MKKALFPKALVLLLLALAPANGERHKIWTQFSYEDFASGKTTGVAIDADGTLHAAATLDSFATLDAERIWDLAQDKDGTLYAATGDGGRLFVIDAKGGARLLFDSPEIALHALAIDKDGTLYAGSAPDGLIYKIDKDGSASTLTHTGSHYVWDLAFDEKGRLHAATGEPAKVLRIDKDGQTKELFAADDRHLMTLLFSQGVLYAGSAMPGRIYEIGNGAGRLLFEATQEEIHALVGADNGHIYAAAIGTKEEEKAGKSPVSALYRLAADGSVHALWNDEAQLADIVPSEDGVLLATDKENRLLHLSGDGRLGLLTQSDDFKTSRLLGTADGTLYLGAGHAGQLNRLGASGDKGYFESKVEDFAAHTQWGSIEWRGEGIEVQTRSGNSAETDGTWSAWSTPLDESGSIIASPPARYIQYKVQFAADDAQLERIALYGLRANLPPAISSLEVQPYRTPQARNGNPNAPPATAQNRRNNRPPQARSLYLIRWQASDPNEGKLVYDLYLRGEDQKEWKMAHENESQTSLLWDTATMPEGWTQLKLVASDRADNPPDQALYSERISAPFAIDNSPPRVELKTRNEGESIVVEIELSDRISALKKVQYSLDYGDDEYRIAALDGMYDSRQEKARVAIADLTPGEHVIAVQAWDALGNVGTQQVIVQVK